MELKELYPVWKELTPRQQALLEQNTVRRRARKGERMHTGAEGCEGLYIVTEGVLRVSTLSEEGGREITLYRLYERDICLFTASCVLSGLQFEPQVQAQTDAEVLVVSAPAYKALMRESLPASAYTNRLMASRFSEVMARLEQILHGASGCPAGGGSAGGGAGAAGRSPLADPRTARRLYRQRQRGRNPYAARVPKPGAGAPFTGGGTAYRHGGPAGAGRAGLVTKSRNASSFVRILVAG